MTFIAEPEFFTTEAEEIELRAYQHACIEELRTNFRNGIDAQVLASMVGSGKTVMGAFLLRECWRKGKRGMFVVDRISLLSQTSAVFDRYGIPHGVIQSGNARYKPGELIQVASVQTLARRGWPDVDLAILDEIHCIYTTHKKYLERTTAKVIGLTATPFTKGMGKLFGGIVNVTTGNKLTEEGFLVPFKVWAAKEPDMTGAKVVAGEWTDEAASERATKIIGDVVAEYQKHGEGGKAIVFGVDVAHCEELQRQALSAGIKAELYTYHTPDEARDYMLREFRRPDSEIRWLISVAALSRGFDVPDVSVIIMCRPLKASFSEFVQILGRGLRSHPSKTFCKILDLAGNFLRHYPRLMEFMADGVNELDDGKPKPKGVSKPREKTPKKCPKCGFLPCIQWCKACGFIFPPKNSAEHEEGELLEFEGERVVQWDREAKRALYGELRYIQSMKGKSDSWFLAQYKSFTGVWPRNMDDVTPIRPSRATLQKLDELAKGYASRIAQQRMIAGSLTKRKSINSRITDLFA